MDPEKSTSTSNGKVPSQWSVGISSWRFGFMNLVPCCGKKQNQNILKVLQCQTQNQIFKVTVKERHTVDGTSIMTNFQT